MRSLRRDRNRPEMWADAMPSEAGRALANATPAFAVLDWLLPRCDLNETLEITVRHDMLASLTPLMLVLDGGLIWLRPLEALLVLERLLNYGVRLEPNTANEHPFVNGMRLSPLCFALDRASACPHAVHLLLNAGARLAPGEAVTAVEQCLADDSAANGAVALRTLLPVYADKLFATELEQVEAVTLWYRDTFAAPETLDALRLLGVRGAAIRAVVGADYVDEASASRAMRTLDAQRALARWVPADIQQSIAAHASHGETWRNSLGSMTHAAAERQRLHSAHK
jgi:hypothetical protein